MRFCFRTGVCRNRACDRTDRPTPGHRLASPSHAIIKANLLGRKRQVGKGCR